MTMSLDRCLSLEDNESKKNFNWIKMEKGEMPQGNDPSARKERRAINVLNPEQSEITRVK